MIKTNGLTVSLIGGLVVAVSLIALLFIPDVGPAIAMMVGGVGVIGGFMWSLAHFYFGPDTPNEP